MTTLEDLYLYYCRCCECKPNSKFAGDLRSIYEVNGSVREVDSLDLSSNYVGPRGIEPIIKLAKNLYTLQSLDLRHNMLQHEEVEKLAYGLAAHPSLTSLNLSFNKIYDSATNILLHLIQSTPTLVEVRVDANELTLMSIGKIEEALNVNRREILAATAEEDTQVAATEETATPLEKQIMDATKEKKRRAKYVPYKSEVVGFLTKENSGGHYHYASWRANPQYALYLTKPSLTTITLHVQEPQPTRQLGFVVLKGHSLLRTVEFSADDLVVESVFDDSVSKVQVRLDAADRVKNALPYIVIPFTFAPGKVADFTITAEIEPEVDGIVSIEMQERDWITHSVEGSWTPDNSGGSMKYPTWRENDYYRLQYKGPVSRGVATLFFVFSKANDFDDNDHREIGMYLVKPDVKGRPPIRLGEGSLVGSIPHQRQASLTYRVEIPCANVDFFLIPTTLNPGECGPYSIQIFATCPLDITSSMYPHGWSNRIIEGAWDDQRNGGSRKENPTTWVHNPCYEINVEGNEVLDVFVSLERGTKIWDPNELKELDAKESRRQWDHAHQDIGMLLTTTEGELSVAASTSQWSSAVENELWVNNLPPGKYYFLPVTRLAGHHDQYTLRLMMSRNVHVSFEIPLNRRLREKQLQRYAQENEERKKKDNDVSETTAQQLAITDEDYELAVSTRDKIIQKYMSEGVLFVDRDFPAGVTSLWLDAEDTPKLPPANVFTWKRPSDIQLDQLHHQQPKAVQDAAPSSYCTPDPLVFAPSHTVQGCLPGPIADEWFLSALGVISTRPYLLKKIIGSHYPEYGFCQFRFFKNGQWTTITIDDQLPVDALSDLCFAKGVDPNCSFVPLVEKAYAKLNRCYQALEDTAVHTPSALMDLTGGICFTTQLQTDQGRQWAKKNLWPKLMQCREQTQLMALSLRRDSPSAIDKHYAGIHLDRAYAILDSREVEGRKLVRLHNFWGTEKLYRGKWTSGSAMWDATLKKAVEYVEERESFWMNLDEVSYYFSELYTIQLFPHTAWAHGGFSADHAGGNLLMPTWVNNPQYALHVHTDKPVQVHLGIHQPDGRMSILRRQDAHVEYNGQLGLTCIRTTDSSRRLMTITSNEVPDTSAVVSQRDNFMTLELHAKAQYILMPFSMSPRVQCNFLISCWTMESPCSISLIQSDRNVTVDGEWKGFSAGGPRGYGAWRNNPQYLLYPSENTQVTIVLRQRNELDSTAAHIGFTVLKANSIRRVLHYNPDDLVLGVKYDNDHAVVGHVAVQGMKERNGLPYVIVPSTSMPHLETGFTLEVVSNRRMQLKEIEPKYDWHRVDLRGSFQFADGTAGGSMKFSSWRNNPQYLVHFPTERSGTLLVVLTKKDQISEVGLCVMKSDYAWHRGRKRKLLCNSKDILAESSMDETNTGKFAELSINYQVKKEPLVVMPFTAVPMTELEYELSFYCSGEITVEPVEEWHQATVEGSWDLGMTAGGSRDANRSWINNPFYCLSLTRPTRVVIVGLQYPDGPEKPVAKKVGRSRVFLPPPILSDQRRVCFGIDLCHSDALQTDIMRTKHTYDGEVNMVAELEPCQTTPYLIVPHTFDPEQSAQFKLLVYADEPMEVYYHDKPRRFY